MNFATGGSVSGALANLIVLDSSGGQGTLDLSNADTSGLSGSLVLEGGFVAANVDMSLPGKPSGTLVFNGGGLRWSGEFDIPSSEQIAVRAGGATFDANGYTPQVNATLGSTTTTYPDGASGGITVMDSSTEGTGIITVTGVNICSSGTTIASGTLAVGSDATLGTSNVPADLQRRHTSGDGAVLARFLTADLHAR